MSSSLSSSRLSVHLIGDYSTGAQKIVAAGPRLLKAFTMEKRGLVHDRAQMHALSDYKRRWPDGVTVLRVFTTGIHFARTDDPVPAARTYWLDGVKPFLVGCGARERALVDYLEGPNECEVYPAWESVATARWYARFWMELVNLMHADGWKACVGSIPVGNPPGSVQEMGDRIEAFAPALRYAARRGGSWSYHSYTLDYTTDLGGEMWTSLRHRFLLRRLRTNWPDVFRMPLLLTEAGVDRQGDRERDGWQARGDAQRFTDWLSWYDARLQEDPQVVGATLFQIGDGWWSSFNVEPIADWLADHLRRTRLAG